MHDSVEAQLTIQGGPKWHHFCIPHNFTKY